MKIHISSKKQIIQVLMLFVVPLVVFLGVYNFYTVRAMNDRIAESGRSTVYLYQTSLEKDLGDIDIFMANLVAGDANYQQLRYRMDPMEAHLCAKEITDRYQELITTKQIIGGMFLFLDQNGLYRERYGGSYSYEQKTALEQYLRELTRGEATVGKDWFVHRVGEIPFLLRVLGSNGAYSICAVDLNRLSKPQDTADYENGVLFYADREGGILTARDWAAEIGAAPAAHAQDPYYLTRGQQEYLAVQSFSEAAGVWFVYLLPYKGILNHLDFVQILLLAVSVFILVLIPISYYLLKRLFFTPMEQLVKTMNAIKSGDLEAKMDSDYRIVEFKQVSDTFNEMMGEIKELKISAYEKELELQQAQLQYLQIQIRPHFFLNCLKNLYALAQERQFGQIQQMILALSDYLRCLFRDNMKLVPLADELRNVRNYMRLQQMSASSPPVCEVEAEEGLAMFQIPPLSLLTFVENSVKHASLPGEELRITIRAIRLETEDAKYVNLSVTDNGSGFPPDRLEELNGAGQVAYSEQCVGIMNVKHRFALLYKRKCVFSFRNLQKGSSIEIFIPDEEERI